MIEHVDAERVQQHALELVEIDSPTGDTAAAAQAYARQLAAAGMDVELDTAFAATPTVIGRLAGGAPGPRVVLNGHLDTVPIPHARPRVRAGRIYGRGAADMKGALASALEAAHAVRAGDGFAGELVIVAIGLHEAPGGRGEDLTHLLARRGFSADAAVVCELGSDSLPVAHVGCATFEITLSRAGIPTHELRTAPGTPHPVLAAGRVLAALEAENERLGAIGHEWVGSESIFVGECHGGDFYNRFPTSSRLVGTRRWAPGRTIDDVEPEFRAIVEDAAHGTGCDVELDLELVRDSYRIGLDHPLVLALCDGYRDVAGRELPPAGSRTVADAPIWQNAGGIPTVYHGPGGDGAHADVESIEIAELVRAARVYVALLERLWAS